MLGPCMTTPFGIHFVFLSEILLKFRIKKFRVYLIAGAKNTNSFAVFGFLLSSFLNIGDITAFLHLSGMLLSLYILFKKCSNLSLNSSGAYLYSSELMLSCPGVLPLSVNFNTVSSSPKVTEACK